MSQEKPNIKLGLYLHFKGDIYQVFGLIRHTETLEWLVEYGKKEREWARPYDNFVGTVEVEDGKQVPRFRWVDFTEDLEATNRPDSHLFKRLDEIRQELIESGEEGFNT